MGFAIKKKRKEIVNFLLCLKSFSNRASAISVRKTCLKVLRLCFKDITLKFGLILARAKIGFFKRFVPVGGLGFKTQLFVKTSLDRLTPREESICIKKNKNLNIVAKKLRCL